MRRPANIFLLAAFLSACGNNGTPDKIAEEHNSAKFQDPSKLQDSKFFVDLASFYAQQIALSRLAQENSTNDSIRTTGKTLEKEYTGMYGSLSDICKQKEISIPEKPKKDDQDANKLLSYEIAEDFDKKYLERSIQAHREAIAEVSKRENTATDPDTGKFTKTALGQIRKNLDFILFRHSSEIRNLK
jgi:predicted outer membrane protein